MEDSLMSQQLMVRFLEGLCEVRVVPSLALGWDAIRSEPFDLVIADYLFPVGDLLVFLKQARALYDTMTLPIIVASGSLDQQMVSQSMRLGANDCLQKPFRKADVQALVEKMLEAPYVREIEANVVAALTVEWSLDGRHFEYAPELNKLVEGESADAANALMRQLLHEELRKGAKLGYVVACRTMTHLVEPETPPAAGPAAQGVA
jgi:CheY-like chemotaxis protein